MIVRLVIQQHVEEIEVQDIAEILDKSNEFGDGSYIKMRDGTMHISSLRPHNVLLQIIQQSERAKWPSDSM